MQKEKSVKSYTRRTKSGKTVVVHAYKAKYDAAEEMRKALAKKEGAGKELANKRKQVEQPIPDNKLGFSAEEFKAWYHWDTESDPKNKAALKVEKALKKSMGAKGYKKFYDDMTDGYSARGHNKAFKGLESSLGTSKSKPTSKTTSKTTASPVDEEVFLKKYDSKEKAAIKKGIREARTSGKTLYITKDSDNQLSIGENTYGDNVVGTIHPNGKLYRGEVTSKSVTPKTKDKTPPKHVTEKSLKQNREGVAASLASAKKEMEKLRLLRKETPAEDKKAHRSVSVKVGKLQKKIWKMEKEWEREQLDNAKKIPDSIMAIAGTRKAPLHSSGFAALSNGKNINYAVVGGNYYRVTEKQLDTIWERSYATRKRRPTK